MNRRPQLKDLEELPATLSVAKAAELLGVGKSAAYEAVRQGRIPAIRVSERRIVVPTAPLLKMLGSGPGEGGLNKPSIPTPRPAKQEGGGLK